MKINSQINAAVIRGAVGLLSPYVPSLNASNLVAAIKAFDEKEAPPRRELMTRKEAAKALSVSMPTVHRLINSGKLRRIQVSTGCVRIDADSVDALLNGAAEVPA